MFCHRCSEKLQPEARFCTKCGAPVAQPVEGRPPGGSSPDIAMKTAGAIWNPNAASNWSIIFSPAFGSYLHSLNWRALGEEERARSATGWFYFSLAMLAFYIFLGIAIKDERAADATARGLALLYLIVWYFAAGRAQARYVKAKFGSEYPRRSWGKPLLIGVLALVGYFVLAVIIGAVVGVAN